MVPSSAVAASSKSISWFSAVLGQGALGFARVLFIRDSYADLFIWLFLFHIGTRESCLFPLPSPVGEGVTRSACVFNLFILFLYKLTNNAFSSSAVVFLLREECFRHTNLVTEGRDRTCYSWLRSNWVTLTIVIFLFGLQSASGSILCNSLALTIYAGCVQHAL